ncbi:hypothetical protein [Devosia rhizoryzae]|uniref:Uncharacterized protein n=1 Tax=Devosia rhizoryzae TaxID=2774137 RepID=A0ABX7C9L7_9HYPH|nr:hypothetical protein [Devosia rhizoryzae]QQR39402.1 hypothetical protein JI748_17065 [Devosia rhizoryzae]
MDQPTSETPGKSPEVVMAADTRSPEAARPRRSRLPIILGTIGALAGLGALGTTIWFSAQGEREILRLSTELAQLRVSLDLYARSQPTAAAGPTSEELTALADRLTALEEAQTAAVTLPPIAPASTPAVTATGEDCLPVGMRLLVAMGDKYQICGQPASVEVGMIDNGYMTLVDGTTIPSGGSMPLPNSACTIGVTSGGDEGLTGYAEIRVSC